MVMFVSHVYLSLYVVLSVARRRVQHVPGRGAVQRARADIPDLRQVADSFEENQVTSSKLNFNFIS